MDLAKIRKKAQQQKKSGTTEAVAPNRKSARDSASVQATPASPEVPENVSLELNAQCEEKVAQDIGREIAGEQITRPVVESVPSTVRKRDPLDELFRQAPDILLATEESYLRALNDDQNVDEEARQWLTFSLAAEEYALEIETIDEICKPREVTEVPNAPAFVLGLISLRGKIVPVYDLRCRLQLGSIEMTPATRIIVCQIADKIVGLLVDSITQVVRLKDDEIEPPPMVLSGVDRDMLEGVGRSQGRILILLNLYNVITIDKD